MKSPELNAEAFKIIRDVTTEDIYRIRSAVTTGRPPGEYPDWSMAQPDDLDTHLVQFGPDGGAIFIVRNNDTGEGAVAYTPEAAGVVAGGDVYQAPAAAFRPAFDTDFGVPNNIIRHIHTFMERQTQGANLPNWKVVGNVLSARIQQTHQGEFIASVTNNRGDTGNISFSRGKAENGKLGGTESGRTGRRRR